MLRLDAGASPRPDNLIQALRAAIDAHQPKLAGRLVEAMGDGPHGTETERLLMHAAAIRNRWDEAEVAFKRASAGVEGATRQAVFSEWGILNSEFQADPADAVTWAKRALAQPGILPDTAEQLELAALRGMLFSNSMAQAVAAAEAILKHTRSAETTQLARMHLGTALTHLGPMARPRWSGRLGARLNPRSGTRSATPVSAATRASMRCIRPPARGEGPLANLHNTPGVAR